MPATGLGQIDGNADPVVLLGVIMNMRKDALHVPTLARSDPGDTVPEPNPPVFTQQYGCPLSLFPCRQESLTGKCGADVIYPSSTITGLHIMILCNMMCRFSVQGHRIAAA
jgi:hypothetical protein